MTKKPLPLKSVRIRNFKAIHDSGTIELTPLTMFVGNNGAGKSSVIEALEFTRTLAMEGLDRALEDWYGLEHVWHKGVSHQPKAGDVFAPNPLEVNMAGHTGKHSFSAQTQVSFQVGSGASCVAREHLMLSRQFIRRRQDMTKIVEAPAKGRGGKIVGKVELNESIMARDGHLPLDGWSFLELTPRLMAVPKKRVPGRKAEQLSKTGHNLAEYLLEFYEADKPAFKDLLDVLRMVLPFARELSTRVVQDLIESRLFLQMKEHGSKGDFDLPSWVLSTGTLRILALLASLRHPTRPPSVLFVDELENGLDPRTIGLLVEEIRSAVESGSTQVIATTHSPYLMDQLALMHLVLVERKPDEPPTFTRPAEDKQVQEWNRQFAPGRLYAMGTLSNRERP